MKKGIVGLAVVLFMAFPAWASIVYTLENTGWQVEVPDIYEGDAIVVVDAVYSSEEAENFGLEKSNGGFMVLEIYKDFTSQAFDLGMGQPIVLKFRLVDREAENFVDTIIIRDELIANLTGRDWSDFHMCVAGQPDLNGFPVVAFDDSYGFEAGGPGNPFQSVSYGYSEYMGIPVATKINLNNGVMPNGSEFTPGLGDSFVKIDTAMEEGQYFILKEWPTVPETATLIVLGFGGIVLLRKRIF